MGKAEKLQRILDQTVLSLEGIERPVLIRTTQALGLAQQELVGEMRRWLSKHHGHERFTAQRHRNVFMNIQAALGHMKASGDVAEKALKDQAKVIAGISLGNVKREWVEFSTIFEGSAQPLALDEAVILLRGDKLLWKQFATSAKKYGGRVGTRVAEQLAVSRIRGESIYELTGRLEKTFPKIFKENRADAARLARSESLNAYNEYHRQSIHDAHTRDPEVCKRWDATPDIRLCPMCGSLDGQVRKPGENYLAKWMTSSKKNGVKWHVVHVRGAPGHPCCRCVECIWKRDWED